MQIGVTGSSGMIGRRLVDLISVLGHQAIRIVRPKSNDFGHAFPLATKTVVWDEATGFDDNETVEGLDAVIHLAGKGIASSRWNKATKQSIRDSRVNGTKSLVEHLSKLSAPPKALVCASGVGVYGDRKDHLLDESEPAANDFLATLAQDWELAALGFEKSGNRVALGRLGMALHPLQGALSNLLLPFRLGLGGPVGNGRQYWSWIDVDDAAAAFLYLAVNPRCSGAYNLVAPEQTDNRSFSKSLGRVLHRPAIVPVPTFAVRMMLGEMADALLLASTRATPSRLSQEGFPFRSPTLANCLKHILGA